MRGRGQYSALWSMGIGNSIKLIPTVAIQPCHAVSGCG